jgi:hypothetical protein
MNDRRGDPESWDETYAVLADEQTVATIRESQAEIERGEAHVLTRDEALALITRRQASAEAPGSGVSPTRAKRAPEGP